MKTTMQLLHKALAQEPSASFWCRELQMHRTTLTASKMRGRLSPTIAGNLARLLGEDVSYWVNVAALEAEPPTYGREKLRSMLLRNSYFASARKRRDKACPQRPRTAARTSRRPAASLTA